MDLQLTFKYDREADIRKATPRPLANSVCVVPYAFDGGTTEALWMDETTCSVKAFSQGFQFDADEFGDPLSDQPFS